MIFRSLLLCINSKPIRQCQFNVLNRFYTGKINTFKNPNPPFNMDQNQKFKVLPSPIKSNNDKKDYRVIQLENGLTACLISDPSVPTIKSSSSWESFDAYSDASDGNTSEEANAGSSNESECSDGSCSSSSSDQGHRSEESDEKMAAAAMCVKVGSFSDPKEVPGMAHFLEHMVFMGSEKYPNENDFDSFLKKGGGSNNASTDLEMTIFHFECLEKYLQTALDKFSQFFISPLMKKEAMTRERESIESEFQMALPSDISRQEQLFFSFAKPDSPVNSFSWGNSITLRDNISDDKLYEAVHKFRKRHYSAHRMTLAIQARMPLETLQTFLLECFSKVPNNQLPPDDFSKFAGNVFDTPEFYKMYYVNPVHEMCRLELTWCLPSLLDKYKSNPLGYVGHLLDDEGKTSLTSYLKKKLWVISVASEVADPGSDSNSLYTFFGISVSLTEEGFKHLNEVIEAIFSYINLLKKVGPQERIFNEIKNIADAEFKFAPEDSPVDYVERLCEDMQIYPPEHYITGSDLYYEYDPELIRSVTDQLRPDKMNVMIFTKKLPDSLKFTKKEQWFGTQYLDLDIPKKLIEKCLTVEPYLEFDLPPPNPYITEDFSILPESPGVQPEHPQKILSSSLFELWYKKDEKFKLPNGYYYFYLINPLPLQSAANCTMLDILMNMFYFACAEEMYPAVCACLYYKVSVSDKGIQLKIDGFNEKLPLVLGVATKYLANLTDYVTEDMFNAVKKKAEQNYHNRLMSTSSLAKEMRFKLSVKSHWTIHEKYSCIKDITFDQFKEFYKCFMESMYVKALVQGNVSEDVAVETVNNFVEGLNTKPLPEGTYPLIRVFQMPAGEKCLVLKGFNKKDVNSIIVNYYQASPFTVRSNVIIEFVMQVIEEPMFNVLRTKEQLGYHVGCVQRDTFGIQGFTMNVNFQITKFSSDHLDDRIEKFLKSTHNILKKMTKEEFEEAQEDLIRSKQIMDIHLEEEISRYWTEICNEDYMFDRVKVEIESIKTLTLEEIREFWKEHTTRGEPKFRKVSIQVVGHDSKADKNNKNNKIKVDKSKIKADKSKLAKPSSSIIDEDIEVDVDPTASIGELQITKNKKKKAEDKYFIEDVEEFTNSLYLYPPIIESNKD